MTCWSSELIYHFEILRDCRIIDLDDAMRRKENTSQWIFPNFAEDIFQRRLVYSGIAAKESAKLRFVMGKSPNPKRLAKEYVGTNEWSRAIKVEPSWNARIQMRLDALYREDPLGAETCGGMAATTRSKWQAKREIFRRGICSVGTSILEEGEDAAGSPSACSAVCPPARMVRDREHLGAMYGRDSRIR